MHIVLDFRPALRQSTGVGTYIRNLASSLGELYPDDRYTLFSASWKDRLPPGCASRGTAIADWKIPVQALDWAWHRWQWPAVERLAGAADIAHSPSPMLLPTRRARTVVTVHDCYFLRHPEDVFGPVRRDYVPLAKRAARQADAVVTVSRTTAEEARELLGLDDDKICVTPLGVDPSFAAADESAARPILEAHGLDRDFLLFVGRREPRKDLGTLLTAFDELLRDGHELMLALAGPDAPGWEETWAAASDAARSNTRLLPHLDAAALPGLYAAATVVVMPSRWEGFGLTGLEAMAAGTPVVASEVGALPETLAGAALFAEAGDAAAMAEQCRRVLHDTDLAERLRSGGLLEAWPEDDEIILYARRPVPWSALGGRRVGRLVSGPPRLPGALWEQTVLPRQLGRDRVDALLSPAYGMPLAAPCGVVVGMHDCACEATPQEFGWLERRRRQWVARRACERAAYLLTGSRFAAAEIERWYGISGPRVVIADYGVGRSFRDIAPSRIDAARRRYGLDGRAVLFVGAPLQRRNLGGLVGALERLRASRPDVDLCFVGPRRERGSGAASTGEGLRWLGYVPDHDLAAVYAAATVVAYPSTYEGFGFPVLEALACGTPVVTSKAGSLPELFDRRAWLVEDDADAWVGALSTLLDDPDERHRRVAASQEWALSRGWGRAARLVRHLLVAAARGERGEAA